MATPDNANPIIHSTASRTTAHSLTDGGLSWSLSKEQDAIWQRSGTTKSSSSSGSQSNEDEDEYEEVDGENHEMIDRDEIFGTLCCVLSCTQV